MCAVATRRGRPPADTPAASMEMHISNAMRPGERELEALAAVGGERIDVIRVKTRQRQRY